MARFIEVTTEDEHRALVNLDHVFAFVDMGEKGTLLLSEQGDNSPLPAENYGQIKQALGGYVLTEPVEWEEG